MAMIRTIDKRQSSLKRRIRQFYNLLNQGDFKRCYQMIDSLIRLNPASVTLFQYENALRQFLDNFGSVNILEINIRLHLNEPSQLYEGRDFAVGRTTWEDERGKPNVFSERWVLHNRVWYTRSTGFVVPTTAKTTIPLVKTADSIVHGTGRRQTRKVKSS